MSELRETQLDGFDGAKLAVYRLGSGRPVLLLHGLFSGAQMNWIKFGHAQVLADAGFEAIMPDLRAHGDSATPHDPAAYPANVLVRDVLALVDGLELEEYDLVGFSMGARAATAAVIAGLRPRRLVLAGMGLESLDNWHARAAFFIDAIDRFDDVKQGDPAFFAVQFMKTMKIDRVAARLLLQSGGEIVRADLAAVTMPTLMLCGVDDHDNGSPQALLEALSQVGADARLQLIPGNHMSCVTRPDMGAAIAGFLLAP